ncbi:MAG: SAM-dependent methyltransferase [Francisellaceae bacterium]|nr:SAM-dependent methyltransferase [Francisellaceae bacterium]MBT6538393.1 SAM-dependent methyltransferase [Francisellaceae bacterium]
MSATITSNHLELKVVKNIQRFGAMSFAKYMRSALYDPQYGYYQNSDPTFGANGDFITAPMLGNLFAKTLATQIHQILLECEKPSIVEIGAGNGQLAYDLLIALEASGAPLFEYQIFETSPVLITLQKNKLKQFPQVKWLQKYQTNNKIQGVIIANEVADALPTHRFTYKDSELYSYNVGINSQQKLCYVMGKLPEKIKLDLYNCIKPFDLPNNYISEYCALLKPWLAMATSKLLKGTMFVFDYGFPRNEFYHPQRSEGTLMCHYKHSYHDNPFINIGHQDITTHIDFTSLLEGIDSTDMEFAGYTSLAGFLTSLNIDRHICQNETDIRKLSTLQHELFTLISPTEMGELFKVLAINKSLPFELQGFQGCERAI